MDSGSSLPHKPTCPITMMIDNFSGILAIFTLVSTLSTASSFHPHPQTNHCTKLKMGKPEKRMEELGITLPSPPKAAACYVPAKVCGTMMYLAGHLPINGDGSLTTGRIGEDGRDVKYGYDAARQVGLNLISTMKSELGDLDKVKGIVKIFGIVQSADSFKEQHLVMNGVSELFGEVFEMVGVHSRSAIGTSTLPLDVSVEVEAIVEVEI